MALHFKCQWPIADQLLDGENAVFSSSAHIFTIFAKFQKYLTWAKCFKFSYYN